MYHFSPQEWVTYILSPARLVHWKMKWNLKTQHSHRGESHKVKWKYFLQELIVQWLSHKSVIAWVQIGWCTDLDFLLQLNPLIRVLQSLQKEWVWNTTFWSIKSPLTICYLIAKYRANDKFQSRFYIYKIETTACIKKILLLLSLTMKFMNEMGKVIIKRLRK